MLRMALGERLLWSLLSPDAAWQEAWDAAIASWTGDLERDAGLGDTDPFSCLMKVLDNFKFTDSMSSRSFNSES